jgi:hypothetical protein
MHSVGWLMLYRKLRQSEVYNDSALLHVFIELLLTAEIADTEVRDGKLTRTIYRGQCFCSQAEIGSATRLSRKVVRRCLETLKTVHVIGQEEGQTKSIITILNFNDYQYELKKKGQDKGQDKGQRRAKGGPRVSGKITNQNHQTPGPDGVEPFIGLHKEKEGNKETIRHPPKQLAETAPASEQHSSLVQHFASTYRARYDVEPPITPKAAGQLTYLGKSLGFEGAKEYITAYLEMNDQWFLTKHHEVGVLLDNLNKVQHYLQTGRAITTTTAKRLELVAENRAVVEQYLKTRKGKA